MSRLARRTAAGVWWMAVTTGGRVVMQLVVLALLARLVTPRQFGIAGVAVLVAQFGLMLAESSVGPSIVQLKELTESHIRTGFTFALLSSVALWGALALAAPLVANLLGIEQAAPLLRVIGVVFVIRNLTVGDFLMTREMRFREQGLIELTGYVVGYGVVAVAFAARGAGAWAIVAGQIGQSSIRTILIALRCRHPINPSLRWGPLRVLLGYGSGQILARIANFAGNQGDNLVVGRTLGPTALGLYGRAYQMMRLPSHMFGQVMSEVLFPAMAKIQDDSARLGRAFLNATMITALVALPASAVAALVSRELVETLLGPRWLSAAPAFQVMALGIVFSAGSKLSDALARATGAVYRRAWRQFFYAGAVVAGALLGSRYGVTGVAAGVLAANIVNFLIMAHLSLMLAGSGWRQYGAAHLAAFTLASGVLAASWPAAAALRGAGARPEVTVVGAGLAAAVAVLALARVSPRLGVTRSLAGAFSLVTGSLSGRSRRLALRLLGPAYDPKIASLSRPG